MIQGPTSSTLQFRIPQLYGVTSTSGLLEEMYFTKDLGLGLKPAVNENRKIRTGFELIDLEHSNVTYRVTPLVLTTLDFMAHYLDIYRSFDSKYKDIDCREARKKFLSNVKFGVPLFYLEEIFGGRYSLNNLENIISEDPREWIIPLLENETDPFDIELEGSVELNSRFMVSLIRSGFKRFNLIPCEMMSYVSYMAAKDFSQRYNQGRLSEGGVFPGILEVIRREMKLGCDVNQTLLGFLNSGKKLKL